MKGRRHKYVNLLMHPIYLCLPVARLWGNQWRGSVNIDPDPNISKHTDPDLEMKNETREVKPLVFFLNH